jgi:predicted dienelactone hydrolase
MILAASSEDGLSLLNVLQKFPTSGIRIDLGRSLEVATDLRQLLAQTEAATNLVARQASAEAMSTNFDNANISNISADVANLGQTGPFAWRRETLSLTDASRNRSFPVDYYFPQPTSAATEQRPFPVVVISHGLGNDRTTYAYLARHLASYGFVVAVPEHPGSSADQLQALASGRANEVTGPQEFINRPRDVSYLLDDLEQRLQTNPELHNQVDLSQIGVIGQSFGGYTALTLAGATINQSHLAEACRELDNSYNLSLLLQCQARALENRQLALADPRINAAIAINPAGSALFGPEGFADVDIPLMIVAGSADTVTPALIEQIRPFTWLTNETERYLVLMQQGTHFSTMAASEDNSEVVPLPPGVIGPDPELAQQYAEILSLIFFETYLSDNGSYQALLNADYVNRISQAPLTLNLIESLNPTQLKDAITDIESESELPKRSN